MGSIVVAPAIEFRDLRVDDGRLIEVVIRPGSVVVNLQDWRGHRVMVTFEDVVAFEGGGGLDTDLSHLADSADDPWILTACARADESPQQCRCYSMISAWTGEPILRVVARRAAVADPS